MSPLVRVVTLSDDEWQTVLSVLETARAFIYQKDNPAMMSRVGFIESMIREQLK